MMTMNKTDKLTPTQRIAMLNAIAERDHIISEKDKEIAEQKREVAYYKRQYEIAVKRRLHERHDRVERRKDIIAFAVLLLIISAVFVPMMLGALRQFNLWLAVG